MEETSVSDLQFQYLNLIDKMYHVDLIDECKKSKEIYLLDRYKASGYVYGVHAMLKGNSIGLTETQIRYINEEMLNLLPDTTIDLFLNIEDMNILLNRIFFRKHEASLYENYDFLMHVSKEYSEYYSHRKHLTISADLNEKDSLTHAHTIIQNWRKRHRC